MFKKLALAATLAFAAGTASASAVTYDYTGSQMNAGGPALSCEARGIFNTGCNVTYNEAGLGVDGFGFGRIPDTTPGLIDGFPLFSSERLIIDFGVDTIWHSITFGRWDRDDDARVSTDSDSFTYGPGSTATLDLGGAISKSLTISAYGLLGQDGCFFCKDPEWKFDKFTVASIDIEPVPLPAAGWMLVAGLAGLGVMRKRKKATA